MTSPADRIERAGKGFRYRYTLEPTSQGTRLTLEGHINGAGLPGPKGHLDGVATHLSCAQDTWRSDRTEPTHRWQAGCVLLLALGASDCEALRDGWLGQPVNTLSSVAYVVAGAYVLRRGGPPASALALAAVGVGSVLYHGPMPPGAELAHDGSMVALAATIPLVWRRGSLRRPPGAAVIAGAAAIVVNLLTRTGAPLCSPESVLQGHGAWHILTATAIALWFAPPGGPRRVDPSRHEQRSRPHQPASPPVRSQT